MYIMYMSIIQCIQTMYPGASVDSGSWSIGDSVLDEISSKMSVQLVCLMERRRLGFGECIYSILLSTKTAIIIIHK